LIHDDGQQDFILAKFEEGKLIQESVTKRSNTQKAVETVKRSGGFSILWHMSRDSRKILKVEYHDNLFENLYVILYYQRDEVVYGKIEYRSDGDGSSLFNREEYYRGGKLLHKKVMGCFCGYLQENRPALNLSDEGLKYKNKLSAVTATATNMAIGKSEQ